MRFFTVAPLLVVLLAPPQADAGIHLGMKLACKRYGDVWNSGSQSGLRRVTTSDFARVWSRVPAEVFRELPRGGGKKVLRSHKGNGSGTVTVQSDVGAVTFVLVGSGMKWTVADIHKAGDDGHVVSLKNYLDASLTAGEFMEDLKERGGDSYHDSITPEFKAAFAKLAPEQLERIRMFLPPINKNVKPYLSMRGDHATMRVPVPGGKPQEYATFKLVRTSGWRVDDYSISTGAVEIASFRKALPIIACSSTFGEFVQDPACADPAAFVASGRLRDELVWAKAQGKPILPAADNRDRLVVAPDGMSVDITYPTRQVRMKFRHEGGRCLIDNVAVKMGDNWQDVSGLLSVKRQLASIASTSSLASIFSRPKQPAQNPTQSNATQFASAVEREPNSVINAVAKVEEQEKAPTVVAAAKPSKPAADAGVKTVTYKVYSQPVYRTYEPAPRRPRLPFGLFRRR